MKKVMKAIATLMLMVALVCATGCTKPEEPNNETLLPQVKTTEVVDISTTSATCGGEIISNGNGSIIECGVCWGTEAEPSINDNYVIGQTTTGSFTVLLDSLSSNTTYTVRAYAKNEAGIGYGNVVSFTTFENGGDFNDHEYVNLGLPSGILWATCNVGANTPEEYGDYFAWGETTPKDYYDWTTYQYANGTSWSDPQLTKYCTNPSCGYNGFTDNQTTILPEDDAARANWGAGWRMPTGDEWQELLHNTTQTWTTQNGVYGRLFIASNDNSLFLPAAGRWHGEQLYAENRYGFYWSSSLYTSGPFNALGFEFSSGHTGQDNINRYEGRSMRAVREN